ncbi:MAG: bifunctional diguanylate cyclase/phosphodiesterase, partial [Hydrogenoanaerobacterium sp.]
MLNMIYKNALFIISLIFIMFGIFFAVLAYFDMKSQKALKKLAYEDSLTGLSTLTKFKLDAKNLLKNAKSGEYTLSTIDVDNFKFINDSFGYSVGDEALVSIAKHFKAGTYTGELLARTSADNFAFLGKTTSYGILIKRFNELAQMGGHIYPILPEHYSVSFSCGSYVITDPKIDLSLMLDRANMARKSIKGGHGSLMTEYTEEMNEQMQWKREVTLSMELALKKEEFVVFLQPKYSFKDGKIVGAEALIRWNHPQKGLIPPIMFVPIFEKNGFIKKIDLYVFEQTCQMFARWRNAGFGDIPITVSVNLSRLHIHNANLAEQLLEITQKYEIDPSLIELELTESMVFYNTVELIDTMHKLKSVGFKISVDDFGSGYSSLNLLKDLPADILKLDKAFLDGLESSDSNNAGQMIIKKIIEMAQCLNLITVAEGVETAEQVKMLTQMGCNIAQGYYYAKPMPMKEFENLLLPRK